MSKYDNVNLQKDSNWSKITSLLGNIADMIGIGDQVDGILSGVNSEDYNANKVYNQVMNMIISKYSKLENNNSDKINELSNALNNFGYINSTALKGRIQAFKDRLTNDLKNATSYGNQIASSKEQATNLASSIIGTRPSTAKAYSEQIANLVNDETKDLADKIDRRL